MSSGLSSWKKHHHDLSRKQRRGNAKQSVFRVKQTTTSLRNKYAKNSIDLIEDGIACLKYSELDDIWGYFDYYDYYDELVNVRQSGCKYFRHISDTMSEASDCTSCYTTGFITVSSCPSVCNSEDSDISFCSNASSDHTCLSSQSSNVSEYECSDEETQHLFDNPFLF